MSRTDEILMLLQSGPRSSTELVNLLTASHGRTTSDYVAKAVARLRERGYRIENQNPAGSQSGAYYVLMSRPVERGEEKARCLRCGAYFARDQFGVYLCSPCQKAVSGLALFSEQTELDVG